MQNIDKDFNEMIKKYADELLSYSKKSGLQESASSPIHKDETKKDISSPPKQNMYKTNKDTAQSDIDGYIDIYKKIASQNKDLISGSENQKKPGKSEQTETESYTGGSLNVFHNDNYRQKDRQMPQNEAFGIIRVHVYTGCLYIPVENAKVTIYKAAGGEEKVFAVLYTDFSGRTKEASLPAPESNFDAEKVYFETYSIKVEASKFQPVIVNEVMVYQNIKSIVQIELLPISFV